MEFKVMPEDGGIRLDRFLRLYLGISFVTAATLVRKKKVFVNGATADCSARLTAGETVTIAGQFNTGSKLSSSTQDSFILNKVIHKDDNIVAIDKPYNLAVQGGTKIIRSLDDMLPALSFELSTPPKLTHRLDKKTSGVIVLGRTDRITRALTQGFRDRMIQKRYLAILNGRPNMMSGTIRTASSVEAVTEFYVLSKSNKHSLVEFRPITGRKHQIRLHALELGCSILGDDKYGDNLSEKYMYLHAWQITIPALLPLSAVVVRAPIPHYFLDRLTKINLSPESIQ